MTAILSWFNREKGTIPYIMTVGDTKISNGTDTLLLEGSKILELPIRVRDMNSTLPKLYFSSSLSFSYAGSTLVGLNVYCTLQAIFANIGGLELYSSLPDYISISEKAKDILKIYSINETMLSEIALSGFCPKSKRPFISVITPNNINGTISYTISYNTSFSNNNVDVVMIGDKKKEILEILKFELSKQNADDSTKYWRTPVRVLKTIIEEKLFNTIGGGLQLTSGNEYIFKPYSIVKTYDGDKATLKYRNLDIFDDIELGLGDCFVTIPAIQIQ